MHNIYKATLVGGLLTLSANVAVAQSLSVSPGDLLAAFYQLSPSGSTVESNTYVFNLGAGSAWRENSTDNVLVGNISADLEAAFGAGWAEDTQLRWTIVGAIGASEPVTNGDPARTTYFSKAKSDFQPDATTAPTFSASQRGTLTTFVTTFSTSMNGQPASINNSKGAIVASSINNNVTSYVPPVQTTFFGLGASPVGSFGVGTIGAAENYSVEAALDVYRTLHSSTNADLTAGMASGNAVVGTGVRVATFTLDSSGNVRMDMAPTQTLTGYPAWVQEQGLTGGDAAASADPDNDGIKNALEFVTGGNPKVSDVSVISPMITSDANQITFTFRLNDQAAYLAPVVQMDNDLVGPWTTVVNGVGGAAIVTTNDFYGVGVDRVTVTLTNADLKNFLRLAVANP